MSKDIPKVPIRERIDSIVTGQLNVGLVDDVAQLIHDEQDKDETTSDLPSEASSEASSEDSSEPDSDPGEDEPQP